MLVNLNFQDHLFLHGAGLRHFTTRDFGATFTAVPTPGGTIGKYAEVKLHPNQPNWVLTKVSRARSGIYDFSTPASCPWKAAAVMCSHALQGAAC